MNGLLLVNAPYPRALKFYGQPTSLLYASSLVVPWMEKELPKEHVRLLNYNLMTPQEYRTSGEEDFRRHLLAVRPRVVAISTTTASLGSARQLAASAKQNLPKTLVIIGGPHEDDATEATAVWDDNVDFSVRGDGEATLRLVVEVAMGMPNSSREDIAKNIKATIERNGQPDYAYGLGRLLWKTANSGFETLVIAPTKSLPVDLDGFPFPPRHLLAEREKFHYGIFRRPDGTRKPTAQVMTQRGCVAHCDFCSESQRLVRRSVKNVTAELESLRASGYEAIFFDDSTFTSLNNLRGVFLKELLPEVKKLGLECGCQTRVDMVSRDILRDMAESGFSYVYFGVESMVPKLLSALNKHYDIEAVQKAFALCKDVGLRVGVSLLLGAPDQENKTLETLETAETTFREIRKFVDDGPVELVSLNVFEYYPGTTSTRNLAKTDPTVTNNRETRPFFFPEQWPFTLLEENPVHCPEGLREIAGPILEKAYEILGKCLVGTGTRSALEEEDVRRPENLAGQKATLGQPCGTTLVDLDLGSPVLDFAWSPDGKEISTASRDGRVLLWSAQNDFRTPIQDQVLAGVSRIAWASNGHIAIASRDRGIQLWERTAAGLERRHETRVDHSVRSLVWDPSGPQVAVLGEGGSISVLRIQKNQQVGVTRLRRRHKSPLTCVCWTTTGRFLLCARETDFAVEVWDTQTWELHHTLKPGTGGAVSSLGCSPKGHVASVSNKHLLIWSPCGSARPLEEVTVPIKRLQNHTSRIISVAFSSGRAGHPVLLATKSLDDTIRFWSGHNWKELGTLRGPTIRTSVRVGEREKVTFNPHFFQVAAVGGENLIRVWNLDKDLFSRKEGWPATRDAGRMIDIHKTPGIAIDQLVQASRSQGAELTQEMLELLNDQLSIRNPPGGG